MKAGDKVVCVDDAGWLIPDPGYEHLAPKKGGVYVVREIDRVGGVAAISLTGGNSEDFYRACRFRPLAGVKENEAREALAPAAGQQEGELS